MKSFLKKILSAKPDPAAPTEERVSFRELGLSNELCQALEQEGYEHPTKIQAAAIPHIIAGRDILGCAQTGTGKTASFALPLLHRLQKQASASASVECSSRRDGGRPRRSIRILVLAPTRELAIQVKESFQTYGSQLSFTCGVILGGVGMDSQKKMLQRGIDILIATPGRFLDLYSQGEIQIRHIDALVLDEADRMLDMGFLHDVRKIIEFLPRKRQNLLFSATMPDEIEKLSMRILKDPLKIAVTPVSSTNRKVEQCVYFVGQSSKKNLLLHLLKTEEMPMTLVFTRTKATANRVSQFLTKNEVNAEAIHGNKSQNARQRALANFKSGAIRVLVSSDLAARGIDIDGISHVVNYDLPNVFETYVHRIGRTGRADATGHAIAFCHDDERPYLKGIEKLIKEQIPVVNEHPFTGTSGATPEDRGQRFATQTSSSSPRQSQTKTQNQSSKPESRSESDRPHTHRRQRHSGPRDSSRGSSATETHRTNRSKVTQNGQRSRHKTKHQAKETRT